MVSAPNDGDLTTPGLEEEGREVSEVIEFRLSLPELFGPGATFASPGKGPITRTNLTYLLRLFFPLQQINNKTKATCFK